MIGEDLGTVPAGFRETMRSANVLSYRVLVFERGRDGSFVPPAGYPPLAAASAATHDIATLKGFWLGRDIDWRRRLDLYPDADAAEADERERSRDRRLLLDALVSEGLIAPDNVGQFLSESGEPSYSVELGDAILTYLARSRARLMLVQIEDVIAESEQANLPGTTDAHPNWRRRLSALTRGDCRRRRFAADRGLDRGGAAALCRRMSGRTDAFTAIRATYRLQFHRRFTFRDATGLVPYLAALGISHVYASPIMRGAPRLDPWV